MRGQRPAEEAVPGDVAVTWKQKHVLGTKGIGGKFGHLLTLVRDVPVVGLALLEAAKVPASLGGHAAWNKVKTGRKFFSRPAAFLFLRITHIRRRYPANAQTHTCIIFFMSLNPWLRDVRRQGHVYTVYYCDTSPLSLSPSLSSLHLSPSFPRCPPPTHITEINLAAFSISLPRV